MVTQNRTPVLHFAGFWIGSSSVVATIGIEPVSVHPSASQPFLAGVLDHIDAASAALPARPDAALRELRAARALILARLGGPAPSLTTEPGPRLTTREREVLRLLAEGNRNKEIALGL